MIEESTLSEVLATGLSGGAEFAEVFVEDRRSTSAVLDDGRVAIAAMALGVIQACLEQSVQYAKDRNAFGKPIGANQAIAFKLSLIHISEPTRPY